MPDRPLLDRAQLARIAQNVPQTIAGLEKIVASVGAFPSAIEEANALAGSALAAAQGALALVSMLAEALEQVETAPAAAPHVEPDDTVPRAHLGTISAQNADQVEITGGSIDGTPIGQAKADKGSFTDLRASNPIVSVVAPGTAPLVVASNTLVVNLHAALADQAGYANSAGSLTNPTSLPAAATDPASTQTLVNALRAAAISKGL